jgi:outer membrane protein assembly factor BamA
LSPDTPQGLEQALDVFEDKQILQRITYGIGGFRAHLGGLVTGSGFAAGPEYYRHLVHNQLSFRASLRASLKRYYLMDAELDAPHLANDHAFANLYAVHYDYPDMDYYGPGPNSHKTGRADYRLETTSFRLRTGITPVEHLHIGVVGNYLLENVGRGRDDAFISAEKIYSEQTTPGLLYQSNFFEGGGFVQYEWRDHPGGPRYGGNYLAEYSDFSDLGRGGYAFDKLHLEAQQYIPFFNRRRVIALRGRVIATDPHEGDRVPFYLQPTLGGSDDLRGYRAFRFYDNNSAVLNGEYRWEVFSGLDMALFVDAGQVFDRWQQINLRRLNTDYGFGFRFNVGNSVFMRLDTGFSREGFAVWLKFGNVF